MKIAVSGKGGSGKTAFCAVLGLILSQHKKVYMIDADPDGNLAIALGFTKEEIEKLKPISELKDLIYERTGVGSDGLFFSLNPEVSDIPEKYSLKKYNLWLLQLGTVKKASSGCYCPENAFLRTLLAHLITKSDETVIIDLPAGIEVLTRGTAKNINLLYIMVEPTLKSVQTAQHIYNLAEELKIPQIIFVGNKIKNSEDVNYITSVLKKNIKYYIYYDEKLQNVEQGKLSILQTTFFSQVQNILNNLLN